LGIISKLTKSIIIDHCINNAIDKLIMNTTVSYTKRIDLVNRYKDVWNSHLDKLTFLPMTFDDANNLCKHDTHEEIHIKILLLESIIDDRGG
jgi:hypothetical protein